MTLPLEAGRPVPQSGFTIRTARCDDLRANLHLSGDLDADGAEVLQQVIDTHVRAGRRYLRLHVGGLRSLGAEAIVVITRAHERLLASRGTMILTGVAEPIDSALRAAAPASPLLLLPPTADERLA